jgi:hypothetical protein
MKFSSVSYHRILSTYDLTGIKNSDSAEFSIVIVRSSVTATTLAAVVVLWPQAVDLILIFYW